MTLGAVLFDLDNTLIRFSEREFFEAYVSRVSQVFTDIIPPDVFISRLLLSTQALMGNHGAMSNAEHFLRSFTVDFEDLREVIWNRFMAFYDGEYDQFRGLMTVPDGGRETVLHLKERGVKVVVASNPIWPLKAQLKRLSWAGLADLEFDLVAHLENMSYCKPQIEFYRDVCARIGESPNECLMVGNDPVNDMVVATIGMRTYLVTDETAGGDSALELSRTLQSGAPDNIPPPDFTGPLAGVTDAVSTLLGAGR
jgi:FMN phosphatase YigB (HAD superfamily)